MTPLDTLRQLHAHNVWADGRMIDALDDASGAGILAEAAHVLGAEEVWLARIEGRTPLLAVWPDLDLEALRTVADAVHAGYEAFLDGTRADDLDRIVAYVNSAGDAFETPLGQILHHVFLHGQYHRGKVNLLLRQAGQEPAPTDFIAFVRGAAAATRQV